jgi:hypothetical protein
MSACNSFKTAEWIFMKCDMGGILINFINAF